MPPHTSLQYTMSSNNTVNSKSTSTASSNNNNNNNTNSTPKTINISTPTKPVTTRQRRATSASSYIFAPSWLTNLNNKTGPATTVLSPAYVSTIERNSNTTSETNEEGVAVLGSKNKDGLGVMVKDSNSSLSSSTLRTSTASTRPKSRDFSLLTTLEETESNEESLKAIHGRARSVSQDVSNISSSPTSFDRNFPTLAKKKQISLSVDLQAKNVDNMWANSDIKSKLLSPTTYNHLPEDSTKLNNSNIDNEPELERRMSLVPKVESGKLDSKRTIIKQSMKRKTSRSLSMDSVARVSNTTINSGNGFGVGISHSNNNGGGGGGGGGRTNGQSQHFRPYLRETVGSKPINIQPQRQRASSISTSNNGIKKNSTTTTTTAATPLRVVSGLSSRRLSVGNNPKYNWSSNHTMGKMGHFKILSEDEEDILNCDDDNNNNNHHHQVEDLDNLENENNNNKNTKITIKKKDNNIEKEISELDKSDKLSTKTTTTTTNISKSNDMGSSSSTEYNQIDDDNLENSNLVPQSPVSTSLEREEKFLRQLGWQKPYEKDDDSSQWAITEEEKRLFINLVRALSGGVSINEKRVSGNTSLSNGEINRAKRNWAAAITIKKQKNGDICIQNQDNLTYIRTNVDNFTFNEKTENKIENNNNDVDNGVFFVM